MRGRAGGRRARSRGGAGGAGTPPGKDAMPFIRRQWTPKQADEWTREDTIAVIISPLVYILLMVGVALSVLTIPIGYVILALGVILLLVLIFVINPKLSAVSLGYERKQKEYIEELERKVKWEE
jgi:hypothetical protein